MNKITRIEIGQIGENFTIAIERSFNDYDYTVEYNTENVSFASARRVFRTMNTNLKSGTWKAISVGNQGFSMLWLTTTFVPVSRQVESILDDIRFGNEGTDVDEAEEAQAIRNMQADLDVLGYDASEVAPAVLLVMSDKANSDISVNYWDKLEGLAIANYIPQAKE